MAIVFCDVAATGANDGTSWEDAYTSLQTAINAATPTTDQVWIKEGYFALTATIACVTSVDVYGGFNSALTGTSGSVGARDYWVDQTILDGQDNVRCMSMGSNIVDGLIVENGYSPSVAGGIAANSVSFNLRNSQVISCRALGTIAGGGLYVAGAQTSVVDNCIFDSNSAEGGAGGAVHVRQSTANLTITNSVFINNTAYLQGGGIYNLASDLSCENCIFIANMATTLEGGALFDTGATSTVVLKRSRFDGNTAYLQGGALNTDGPSTIKECLFTNNESVAGAGGAIYKFRAPSSGTMDVINCTFEGNTAFSGGNAIDGDSTCVVQNCNVWNGSGGILAGVTVTYSNVQGGFTGTGNINSDPLFFGPVLDPDNKYNIRNGSPCIDAANGNAPAESTDILGNSRYDDPDTVDTGVGTPPYVDMGCYEYTGSIPDEFVDLGTCF